MVDHGEFFMMLIMNDYDWLTTMMLDDGSS